jgi:hypothetical protein
VGAAQTVTVLLSILAVGISIGALMAAIAQAGSARKQAMSAKDQAVEELRLLREQRAQDEERARAHQARSIHLNHPERQGGERSGDWNAATSYPVNIHNRSREDITRVEVWLYVDTGEGMPTREGFQVERLLPDGLKGKMYKITAPRRFGYETGTAWTEARFTDALGQHWLIDRDGQRVQVT